VQLLVSASELERSQTTNAEIEIEGDRYRHLFRARRLDAGTVIRVVDGAGRARHARVSRVDRSRAWIEVGEVADSREPSFRLRLAVATLRMERAAWLVEKATEVGAAEIGWFNSRRAPRCYGRVQVQRLERVARSAVEQCGRAVEPSIWVHEDWCSVLRGVGAQPTYLLDPNAERRLGDADSADPALERMLVIGPEGGFDPVELAQLLEAGAQPRTLGERTLRAETAAVAGCALLLC
jgi:16S rRNA (uracil1498-N3)-methyltransferase